MPGAAGMDAHTQVSVQAAARPKLLEVPALPGAALLQPALRQGLQMFTCSLNAAIRSVSAWRSWQTFCWRARSLPAGSLMMAYTCLSSGWT